ncbi:MAG: 3-hydroxyacyl-ACP dehydratase FabZ [Caulobacteraceae bacterium]|nr:3-hydroxyacyl-ACP dehydratase FabZ [Caulobacteraceae bacterium]
MTEARVEEPAQTDIEIQEILRRLPHRPPFLLIDRAENFQPSRSLVGVKCVTMNEGFFVGHFPGHPVMPGVLIIESLAQTGGLLMSKSWDITATNKIILFMSVDHCRFRQPVGPGDVLKLHVEVVRARGDVVRFRGQAMVEEKVVAEAEFTAMMVETTE